MCGRENKLVIRLGRGKAALDSNRLSKSLNTPRSRYDFVCLFVCFVDETSRVCVFFLIPLSNNNKI